MTEDEKLSIFSAPEFLDFVEQSTKIIQRALNDNYDYIRDYTIGAESGTYVVLQQGFPTRLILQQGGIGREGQERVCILRRAIWEEPVNHGH